MYGKPELFLLVALTNCLWAQTPIKDIALRTFNLLEYQQEFGSNKILPKGFEKQTLLALSYFPELKDIHIEFRLTNDLTPLASRPTIWSTFQKPSKRHYIISISTKSKGILDSILLGNLNYNAQVGVLAHELSHVADYHTKNIWQFIRLGFGLFSTKYMDAFEYNTDQLCINHGAGFQLLAWSENVRQYFTPEIVKQYFGENALTTERYMFPETINRKMAQLSIYQSLL